MFGMSFIAGAYNVASNNRRANASHRGRYGAKDTGVSDIDPELKKRVEAIDRRLVAEINAAKPSTINCPECGRQMIAVEVEGIELDTCVHCKGFWFDDGELAHFTGMEQDMPSANLKGRQSRFQCPVCNEPMIESVFQAPFNLLLDRCPHGHGVYCEAREFEWAIGLSSGSASGPRR